MNYSYDFIATVAYISQTQPSTVDNGFLWFNPSNNTLNVLVNGSWYNVVTSLYSLINSINTNVDSSLNQTSNSISNYFSQIQSQFQSASSNLQNNVNAINNIDNNIKNDLNNLQNLINNTNNLVNTDSNLLNQDTQLFDSLSNNVLNNMFLFSSVSFQVLTGYYIYTFNFGNLFNVYNSYFNSGFNIVSLVRRPIRYYYQGANTTAYPNVDENGYYAYYPLMYHADSDVIYNSSNQTGSFSVAIGPTSSGVSDLSQGMGFADYAQDSSAELYEIKFFAGPFNASQKVSTNLSSDGYIRQLYGNTSYKSSYVGSNASLNIFGYSVYVTL